MRHYKTFLALTLLLIWGGHIPISYATISSTTNQTITSNGNGSTQNFTIGFTFRDNDDIQVYLEATNVTPHTRSLLVYGGGAGQYTITGGDPGTTVHMGTAPTSNQRLVIKRNTPRTQTVDFDSTQAFPADSTEALLDKHTMVLQELDTKVDTKVGLAAGSTSTVPTFPEPINNSFIHYDGSGGLETVLDSDVASAAGALIASNNLSDLTNVPAALVNLGLSTASTVPALGGANTLLGVNSGASAMQFSLLVNANIDPAAAIVDTKLATISTAGKVSNAATTATSSNTASAIVARNASGDFSAGVITASLTGNVTGNVTGNASTATALAANPSDCSVGTFATAIAANGDLTCSSGAGDVVGPSSSVDNELALFNSTTGKLIKRAAGTGAVYVDSGVVTQGVLPIAKGGTGSFGSNGQIFKMVSGSPAWSSPVVQTKTANYTVLAADDILIGNVSGSAFTFTLPAASSVAAGKTYTFKKIDTTGTLLTVARAGSDTFGSSITAITMGTFGDSLVIMSDGTSIWHILEYEIRNAARYTTNAGNTITSGSIVDYEDIDYDPLSQVTTGSSWVFTAKIPGTYQVTSMNYNTTSLATNDQFSFVLNKNASNYANGSRITASAATAGSISAVATTVYLTVGDTLNIVNGSGASRTLSSTGQQNNISITRVGN
jgi:hypothetical protein